MDSSASSSSTGPGTPSTLSGSEDRFDKQTDFDAMSLLSITDTIARDLVLKDAEGTSYTNLNEHYPLPYNALTRSLEYSTSKLSMNLHRGELYWEPELEQGAVTELLTSAGRRGKILDVGSGTAAVWAIQMATRFPESEVVALDLMPVDEPFVPPNITLEIWDASDGIPFPSNHFHVIHIRSLAATIPDFAALLEECYRCLTPGGILILGELNLELQAPNGEALCWFEIALDHAKIKTINSAQAIKTFHSLKEMLEKCGRGGRRRIDSSTECDGDHDEEEETATVDFGFVQVEEQPWEIDIGTRQATSTSTPDEILRASSAACVRENLIKLFQLKVISFSNGQASSSAQLGETVGRLLEVDSGIFQMLKSLWARKAGRWRTVEEEERAERDQEGGSKGRVVEGEEEVLGRGARRKTRK